MKEELTDTQIALLIKNALEFNASIVLQASFLYGQDIKHEARKRVARDLEKQSKDYVKLIEKIMGENQ